LPSSVLELQRGGLKALRRDEQVGTHEQLLRRLRAAHERDDLLHVRAVADHLAGQLLAAAHGCEAGARNLAGGRVDVWLAVPRGEVALVPEIAGR
jgi:hypothetical protein